MDSDELAVLASRIAQLESWCDSLQVCATAGGERRPPTHEPTIHTTHGRDTVTSPPETHSRR